MPRQVRFVADCGNYKAGQTAVVDDQLATDAIANGAAVPSIEPLQAPETVAATAAPEAETPNPETPAAEVAPETVAATDAPEVA